MKPPFKEAAALARLENLCVTGSGRVHRTSIDSDFTPTPLSASIASAFVPSLAQDPPPLAFSPFAFPLLANDHLHILCDGHWLGRPHKAREMTQLVGRVSAWPGSTVVPMNGSRGSEKGVGGRGREIVWAVICSTRLWTYLARRSAKDLVDLSGKTGSGLRGTRGNIELVRACAVTDR
jgi:hypothetical protein